MSLRLQSLIVVSLALLSGISSEARAASPWAELKEGMTGEATTEKIGRPLLSTRGRGVEVWIYDHCGEAVFKDGSLLCWSVPVRESAAKDDHTAAGGATAGVMARSQGASVAKVPITRLRASPTVVVSSY